MMRPGVYCVVPLVKELPRYLLIRPARSFQFWLNQNSSGISLIQPHCIANYPK